MKCYQANSGTGLAGLVLREIEEPHAGYRQVLVRVRANSLNFRELSILRGTYPLPVKTDVLMCSDGAGEVIAVGQGVSRAKVGDRVAAAMFPRWIDGPIAWEYAPQIGGSLDGMLSELVVLDEDAVVHSRRRYRVDARFRRRISVRFSVCQDVWGVCDRNHVQQ